MGKTSRGTELFHIPCRGRRHLCWLRDHKNFNKIDNIFVNPRKRVYDYGFFKYLLNVQEVLTHII